MATSNYHRVISFPAGENLEERQHHLVDLNTSGQVVLASTGVNPMGVLVDNFETGAKVGIMTEYGSTIEVVASDAIAIDDDVSCSGSGRIKTAAGEDFIVGKALTAANAAGDLVTVLYRPLPGTSQFATQTTQDITYYVRETGDDNADGLTVGTALRNPQVAVGKVSKLIGDNVLIDGGAGTFDGFIVSGFRCVDNGTFRITGTQGAPTLNGATTGTGGVGSDQYQLVDTSAVWTVNECRGKEIEVGGEYLPIYSNTADTLQFVGRFSGSTQGQTYNIVEPKTVCNTKLTTPSGTTTVIGVSNCKIQSGDSLLIQNIKADGNAQSSDYAALQIENIGGVFERCEFYGGGFSFVAQNSSEIGIRTCTAYGSDGGFSIVECTKVRHLRNAFAYDNTYEGYFVRGSFVLGGDWYAANGNGTEGLRILTVSWIDLDGGQFENNGTHGIRVGEIGNNMHGKAILSAVGAAPGRIKLGGNASGGIVIESDSNVRLANATGTATSGHGVYITSGGKIYFKSGVDVTGPSGDLTINGGVTTFDWATDFPSNLRYATNLTDRSYAERRD